MNEKNTWQLKLKKTLKDQKLNDNVIKPGNKIGSSKDQQLNDNVMGSTPHRPRMDVRLGSPLGGKYEYSLAAKFNPTNSQKYAWDHPYAPVPPSQRDGGWWKDADSKRYWNEESWNSFSNVHGRDIKQLAVKEQYRKQLADEQYINQLRSGSVKPILYPYPDIPASKPQGSSPYIDQATAAMRGSPYLSGMPYVSPEELKKRADHLGFVSGTRAGGK